MKQKQKEALAACFEAPKPKRKQSFLQQFEQRKISVIHMAAIQFRYISKWVWIFSVLICAAAYGFSSHGGAEYIGAVMALVPFLVVLSVTESLRSCRYGMAELELSARFSLKRIVLVRMVVLGIGNIAVLLLASVLLGDMAFRSLVYILVPYFLTAGSGLYLERRVSGSESTMYCFALAALVSLFTLLSPWEFIFAQQYFTIWLLAGGFGVWLLVWQSYDTMKGMEDLVWN